MCEILFCLHFSVQRKLCPKPAQILLLIWIKKIGDFDIAKFIFAIKLLTKFCIKNIIILEAIIGELP